MKPTTTISRARKLGSLLMLVLMMLQYLPLSMPAVAAADPWLDAGSPYRQTVQVSSLSGAGTNYQIKLTLNYSAGTSSGSTIYLGGNSTASFGDVRFYSVESSAACDYWINLNKTVNSDYATVYVEIPNNLTYSAMTLAIYYGNDTYTSQSNGTNTFVFFDDFTSFNTTAWPYYNNTVAVVSGTILNLTGGAITSAVNYSKPMKVEAFVKWESSSAWNSFGIAEKQSSDAEGVVHQFQTKNAAGSKLYSRSTNTAGVEQEATELGTYANGLFQDCLLYWNATAYYVFYVNGTYEDTNNYEPSWSQVYLHFRSTSATVDLLVDWVFVAKGVTAGTDPTLSDNTAVEFRVLDTSAPTYSSASMVGTTAGLPSTLSIKWEDDASISTIILSTNNSGAWANTTVAPSSSWANYSFFLNVTAQVFSYRWYCNDSTGNWNSTSIYNQTTSVGISPFYSLSINAYSSKTMVKAASLNGSNYVFVGSGWGGTGASTITAYACNSTWNVTSTLATSGTTVTDFYVFTFPQVWDDIIVLCGTRDGTSTAFIGYFNTTTSTFSSFSTTTNAHYLTSVVYVNTTHFAITPVSDTWNDYECFATHANLFNIAAWTTMGPFTDAVFANKEHSFYYNPADGYGYLVRWAGDQLASSQLIKVNMATGAATYPLNTTRTSTTFDGGRCYMSGNATHMYFSMIGEASGTEQYQYYYTTNGTTFVNFANQSFIGTGAWPYESHGQIISLGSYVLTNVIRDANANSKWMLYYPNMTLAQTYTGFTSHCSDNVVVYSGSYVVIGGESAAGYAHLNLLVRQFSSDSTPPTYGTPSVNTSAAGMVCLVSLALYDNINLGNVTFSTNNTGTWQNYTTAISGTAYSWSTPFTINSSVGVSVHMIWYIYDAAGNLNTTSSFYFTTVSYTSDYSLSVVNSGYVYDSTDAWMNITLTTGGDVAGASISGIEISTSDGMKLYHTIATNTTGELADPGFYYAIYSSANGSYSVVSGNTLVFHFKMNIFANHSASAIYVTGYSVNHTLGNDTGSSSSYWCTFVGAATVGYVFTITNTGYVYADADAWLNFTLDITDPAVSSYNVSYVYMTLSDGVVIAHGIGYNATWASYDPNTYYTVYGSINGSYSYVTDSDSIVFHLKTSISSSHPTAAIYVMYYAVNRTGANDTGSVGQYWCTFAGSQGTNVNITYENVTIPQFTNPTVINIVINTSYTNPTDIGVMSGILARMYSGEGGWGQYAIFALPILLMLIAGRHNAAIVGSISAALCFAMNIAVGAEVYSTAILGIIAFVCLLGLFYERGRPG